LHRSLDHLKSRAFWDNWQDLQAVKMQEERRRLVLKQLDEMLAEQHARTKR
jgi:hypothetical protein